MYNVIPRGALSSQVGEEVQDVLRPPHGERRDDDVPLLPVERVVDGADELLTVSSIPCEPVAGRSIR